MAFETVQPDDAAYAAYSANFAEFNAGEGGLVSHSFSVIKRNPDTPDHIRAGGRGLVYLGAVEIRGLWVDADLRGTGVGHALLSKIEDEARSRGATRAMLYTYSWQAEAFYCDHGYKEMCRFPFPQGGARIDMHKDL